MDQDLLQKNADTVLSRVRRAAQSLFSVSFEMDDRTTERDKALLAGIANNDVERVRTALQQRAFVGTPWIWKGRERGEAIHFAVHQSIRAGGDLRILDLLIAAGADPQTLDARGRTPDQFLDAVTKRYGKIVPGERIAATREVLAGNRLAAWPATVTSATACRRAPAPH